MAATYEEVMQALRKADAQGNQEDARRLAKIARSMKESSASDAGQQNAPAQAQTKPVATEEPSFLEKMIGFGSPTYSLVRGAVIQPALGVNELLAKTGLFGQDIKQGASALVRQEQAAYEKGRAAVGREGIDVPEFTGAIFSPVNKLMPSANAITGGLIQGGLTPSGKEDGSYLTDKLFNMGLGAVIGGVIPPTIKALSYIKDQLINLPITVANKEAAARRYIESLVGEEKQQVIAALRNAGEIVSGSKPTTAEALVSTPTAIGVIKEQQRLASQVRTQPQFAQRRQDQAAARKQELVGQFGTEADLAAARAARAAETTPLRETALEQANVYGQVVPALESDIAARQAAVVQNLQAQGRTATEEAQALLRERTAPTGREILSSTGRVINLRDGGQISQVAGMPMKFPDRYTGNYNLAKSLSTAVQEFADPIAQRKAELGFKQLQLKSVADEGFYPLTIQPIIGKIDDSLGRVGDRSNALLVNSLQGLRTKLENLADENGIINSVDLYNVRKEIGSDIKSFLTQRNEPFGAQATNVETSIKKILDKSINDASGTQIWSDYLTKFADHSKKINQMKVGQTLIDKLSLNLTDVEKAGTFASAVDNSAALIKKTTGVQRYEKLSDFLTPQQIKSVESVRADLARSQKAIEMGRGVKASGEEAFAGGEKIPGMISSKVTILKSILDTLKTGSQKQLDSKMTELMLDPQKLADFLEVMPKKQASLITSSLMAKMSPEMQQTFKQFVSASTPTQTQLTRGTISQITRE